VSSKVVELTFGINFVHLQWCSERSVKLQLKFESI